MCDRSPVPTRNFVDNRVLAHASREVADLREDTIRQTPEPPGSVRSRSASPLPPEAEGEHEEEFLVAGTGGKGSYAGFFQLISVPRLRRGIVSQYLFLPLN